MPDTADRTLDDEPLPEPYWFQLEDGAAIIRRIWDCVEEVYALGADAKVTLAKPGQPRLTIAFDHDYPEDDDDLDQS